MTLHRQVFAHAPIAVLGAALGACVIAPTDDSTVGSRHTALALSGYASAASNVLELRAWNYQRGAWELVRSFRSGTSAIGRDQRIYGWSTTVPLVGNRYWVSPGAPCATPGTGRFQVRELQHEGWLVLKTFDADGMACLGDEIASGTDFAAAGAACHTGDELRLFAPDACVTAPTSDTTRPSVVLRATDDTRTWEVQPGDFTTFDPIVVHGGLLRLRADGHDPQGLTTVQIDYEAEVLCRAADGSTALRRIYFREYDPAVPPTITPGARVPASFDAGVDLTASSFRYLCPSGTTLRTIAVYATAAAFNRTATPSVTPELRFTLSP